MALEVKAPGSVQSSSEATLADPVEAITARPDGMQACGPWIPQAIAFPYRSQCDSVYDEASWETGAERDADENCGEEPDPDERQAWNHEASGGDPALCDDEASGDAAALDDNELCDGSDSEASPVWDWALNVLGTLVFAAQVNPLSRSSAGPAGIAANGVAARARSTADRSAQLPSQNSGQQRQKRRPTGAAVSRFDPASQRKAVQKSQRLDVTIFDVAKELGISVSTLDKWRARWLPWLAKHEQGGWQAKQSSRSQLSNAEWEKLFQLWPQTPRRQRAAVARQFGVSPGYARTKYRRWKAGAPRKAIPSWNLSWEEVVSRQHNGVRTPP